VKSQTGSQTSVKTAFSLVELLVVMAVIGILIGLAGIAMNHLGRAGALSKTASDIAGILEAARAHSMAHNTYVWVGLKNVTQGNVDWIVVGVVGSRSGEANPGEGGLVQLGRLHRFENFQLVTGLPNTEGAFQRPAASAGGVIPGAGAIFTFQAGSGANAVVFDTDVIQFNSRGEALVGQPNPGDPGRRVPPQRITEIGIQSSIGGLIVNPDNFAVIQIGGLTGSVTLFRP
jgi:prepilin-type N-terminal cleavage/methylation domain-containing protein